MADELHWADWLVFAIFLGITTIVGIVIGFINRGKATSNEFLKAGSQMHFFPVALSLQASFLSAIFIVSLPAESYNFGIAYVYLGFSYFVAFPLIGKLFLPIYFQLKLSSAYEYLEVRFSQPVRIAASLAFLVHMILYISVAIYTPALTIEQVTSMPVWGCVLLVSGICILYTVVGGMRATIWNDVIQMTLIMLMLSILIAFGHVKTGSIRDVYHIASNGSRLDFNVFMPDPTARTTFWTQLIGGTFMNFAMYAASQTVIQKALSTQSLADAQRSMTILSATSTVFLILVMWLGIVMYAYYVECDPQLAGQVESADQLVPKFMMDILGDYPGLPGLFVASIFSGALSTVSGGINSMAGAFLEDFVNPIYFKSRRDTIPDKLAFLISRILVVIFGVLVTVMAFAVPYMGDLILSIALSIFGMLGGPICGLVACGLFLPCVNSWGALTGFIVSLGITMWLGIGTMISGPEPLILPASIEGCTVATLAPNETTTLFTSFTSLTTSIIDSYVNDDVFPFYKVSTMYYGMIAIGICMLVAVLVSAISGLEKDVPHKHIYPCADVCCFSCCPPNARDCFRCGSLPPDDDEENTVEVLEVHFKKGLGHEVVAGSVPGFPIRQLSYTLHPGHDDGNLDLYPFSIEKREREGTFSLQTTLFHQNDTKAIADHHDPANGRPNSSKSDSSQSSDPDEHFALGSGPSVSPSSSDENGTNHDRKSIKMTNLTISVVNMETQLPKGFLSNHADHHSSGEILSHDISAGSSFQPLSVDVEPRQQNQFYSEAIVHSDSGIAMNNTSDTDKRYPSHIDSPRDGPKILDIHHGRGERQMSADIGFTEGTTSIEQHLIIVDPDLIHANPSSSPISSEYADDVKTDVGDDEPMITTDDNDVKEGIDNIGYHTDIRKTSASEIFVVNPQENVVVAANITDQQNDQTVTNWLPVIHQIEISKDVVAYAENRTEPEDEGTLIAEVKTQLDTRVNRTSSTDSDMGCSNESHISQISTDWNQVGDSEPVATKLDLGLNSSTSTLSMNNDPKPDEIVERFTNLIFDESGSEESININKSGSNNQNATRISDETPDGSVCKPIEEGSPLVRLTITHYDHCNEHDSEIAPHKCTDRASSNASSRSRHTEVPEVLDKIDTSAIFRDTVIQSEEKKSMSSSRNSNASDNESDGMELISAL